jgi:hypothetical protein
MRVRCSSRPEPSGTRSVNWRGTQDKETEEGCALMAQEEDHGNTVVSQPRCEIAKTILDNKCERPGEVR